MPSLPGPFLPCLLDFQHSGIACLCALKKHLASKDSSSSKSRFPGDLTVSWKAPKVHSLHSQGFAGIFSPTSNSLKLNSFVVTMTKAGAAHHLAHEPLSVCKQFQESPFPVRFLNTCTKKLFSQKFPGPLCVHCMIFPVELWEVKITQGPAQLVQRYSLILCWHLGTAHSGDGVCVKDL